MHKFLRKLKNLRNLKENLLIEFRGLSQLTRNKSLSSASAFVKWSCPRKIILCFGVCLFKTLLLFFSSYFRS
ncbi:unnamed protein product [Brassica rapa subsp. trilocularis]